MEDICYSCLCSGRNLQNITDTIYHSIYTQILNEISVYNNEEHCRICWECIAVLRKWTLFKNLTQRSYLQLVQCAQQDIPKLAIAMTPRLQTKTPVILSYSPDKLDDDYNDNHQISDKNPVKSELSDEQICDSDHLLIGKESSVNIVQEIKEEVEEHQEPVTFVNDLVVEVPGDVVTEDQETDIKLTRQKKTKRKNRRSSPEPCAFGSEDADCPSPANDDYTFEDRFDVEDSNIAEAAEELIHNKPTKKAKSKTKTKKRKKNKLNSYSTEVPLSPPILENDRDDIKIEEETLETGKEFVCEECGEKFTEKKALERHLKGHRKQNGDARQQTQPIQNGTEEKPRCGECNKVFSSKKTFRYHMNTLHKGHNRYPCPRCGKVYQWKSNLGRHMRSHKAVDLDELYCAPCDRRFASVATHRQHLRLSRRHVREEQFLFVCNDCGKRFVNKTRLRDHIDWDHLNKVKFRCQICNKPFKCHTSLYVHTQNVHNNKERNNLCHVCGKCYQNAAKLRYHVAALHSNSAAYRCSQCSANFGWYSSLYRHLRDVHYSTKSPPKRSKKGKKTDQAQNLPAQPTM